jgi:hypothetical protein
VESVFGPELIDGRATLGAKGPLPDGVLFFATPLYDFGDGFVPARVGDGFITER